MTDASNQPMIDAVRLSKHYAGVVAVRDISFQVSNGEIVGFLGPNGAGKTTTLRMLAGFLPASGGEVRVAGFDVFTHSREVRQRIGYLPENCPLYMDMRVEEYLRYRARLKGVPSSGVRVAVTEAAIRCGLADVRQRIIGQLSKGFRQRVGIADSILHKPALLILDEPTVGLDPNQVLLMRDLIRELGKTMTILLSTHQLSEVEATCRRAIVISGGRIVASDTLDGLRRQLSGGMRVELEVEADADAAHAWVASVPGLACGSVTTADGWSKLVVQGEGDRDPRVELFDAARQRGLRLRELHLHRRSLEEAFVDLTRRDREAAA